MHILQVWEKIDVEDIHIVIESMEQGRRDVLKVGGYSIRW